MPSFDIKISLVPLGIGFSQRWKTHIGLIPMRVGLDCLAAQGAYNTGVGRTIGTAYSKRDDACTLCIEAGNFFELDRKVIFLYLLHATCWHYIIIVTHCILHILLKF